MLNINLTDNVIVIEPDPCNLDAAIHTALDEAREVLRSHYLSEYTTVPPIDVRVSTGKQANNYKNGAHVGFHLLSPPPQVSLLAEYVLFLDMILCRPSTDGIPTEMVSQVVLGSSGKSDRWIQSDHYRVPFRQALKAFFVSLLRQRAVLLPANVDRYLPFDNGTWRGFHLMPERLKEMAAVYYPGTGLDYGVDWNRCTYSWNGKKMSELGIENIPARTAKATLLSFAMCTRWERLDEIDPTDIYGLQSLANANNTIGLYLTYLFLKAEDDKDAVAQKTFGWVEQFPSLRIYTEEYELYAKKTKHRRSNTKRSESGLTRQENLARRPDVDRRSLKERLHDPITEATKEGNVDPVLLARSLGRMSGRTELAPGSKWPQDSVLPDSITFDWVNQTADWLAAFRLYEAMTNYANVEGEFNNFAPFMHYLTVYLPIYFHYNTDSHTLYPIKIKEFNGFQFVSRPIEVPQNLPMTFAAFVREYYNEVSQMRVYTALRKLHHFFTLVLGRRELLGIPSDFINPVLETDIPGTGGRPTKTTKTRLPRKAYWLTLLYAYKVYDYVAAVNEKCINDVLYADRYSSLFHNLDEDEFGLIDIRDIMDSETDRVINFEGNDYEVNLVPSYFFFPTELPLKGKGPRYLVRPHAITHLICALETGIRNQHIQWLSYDFDKNIEDGDIKTEDVYQLFVMTDKSNKSWTALTAGRVIKVLRELRLFRDLIDAESFNDKIYYEGREKNPVYDPFKVLFAFNLENGNPFSDTVYVAAFRYLMAGVQPALDHYGVEFSLFDFSDSCARVWSIKPKLSPHSMRVTVVSEYVQFLNSEYVGKYITKQKLATVWYYTKHDADDLRKMQAEQQRAIAQLSRGNSQVRLMGKGGTTIDATDPNSILAKAFKEDPEQAIADFGAVSSHFFDRETGIAIVTSNHRIILAFEPTHICPFNRICPADRHKVGYANRCNFCDYAIRTVEHLPSLGCRRRDLLEEMERLEDFSNENGAKLTEGQELDIDARRSIIAEDLGSIDLAEKILEQNLRRLKDEDGEIIHVYTPEAVLKKLEAMPFPDTDDEARYLLARINEVQNLPDETRHLLKMKLLWLRNNILANTNQVREMLRRGRDINRVEAQVFSLVNSIRKIYRLSLDELAEIASRDINELISIDHESPPLLQGDDSHDFAGFGAFLE